MSVLEVKNLSIGHEKIIKSNINFTVEKGDYFCIVGENGCGKSTLMKTLLGIIKKKGGEIIYDKSIKKETIAYLSQSLIISKDFPANVEEIVLSGFIKSSIIPSFYTKDEKRLAKEKIKEMGIEGFEKKSFNDLSGGQKQRVLLARALCSCKDILFLDEPVTGLDSEITKHLYDTVYKLNKEKNITIIMISHDIDMVKKYATKVVKLDE